MSVAFDCMFIAYVLWAKIADHYGISELRIATADYNIYYPNTCYVSAFSMSPTSSAAGRTSYRTCLVVNLSAKQSFEWLLKVNAGDRINIMSYAGGDGNIPRSLR